LFGLLQQQYGPVISLAITRGVGKSAIFFNEADYLAFKRVICETLEKRPMRILCYCIMKNHWHFVPAASVASCSV